MPTATATKVSAPAPRVVENDKSIDAVRSRILNELRTHVPSYSKDYLLKMSKNFAFLARQYAGPGIAPRRVSVPLIDILADDGEVVAYRMALVVHEGAGKTRVLLHHRSPVEHLSCLVHCMADLAQKAIAGILDSEADAVVFDEDSDEEC